MNTTVAGVDGCPAGWVAVIQAGEDVEALVLPSVGELVGRLPANALIAIDVPIGLAEIGARECDLAARRLLGPTRASSVFLAPIRPVLAAGSYREACEIRERVEGKRMSQQAFAILRKIREADELLQAEPALRERVKEVHPEVSFTVWNDGRPMAANKKKPAGKAEREALIEHRWPGVRRRLAAHWRRSQVGRDDLNDAFAALWTAERIVTGGVVRIPSPWPPRDALGLPMEMWA